MSFIKYQGPAVLWAFIILVLCSIPFDGVDKSPLFFEGFDKLVHCGLFFVLIIFAAAGNIRQYGTLKFTFKNAFKLFAVVILFGAVIELLQQAVFTWRSGDWNDLFADTVGAGMGIFSILMMRYASSE